MEIAYAGFCDIGKVAPIMEDFINVFDINGIKFLCVADGMGGKKGSNIASNIAIYELKDYLEKNYFDLNSLDNYMNLATYFINRMLVAFQEANPSIYTAFSTSMTIAAIDTYGNSKFYHIGDTRAYLLRNGEIFQLTKDDTKAQELLDKGKITLDEYNQHPERHFLTKTLGSDNYEISSFSGNFFINDTLILVSNGVYDVMSTNDLLDLLSAFQNNSLNDIAQNIIKSVNEISGIDNSSIILATFIN